MIEADSRGRPLSVASYDLAYSTFLDSAFRGFAKDHDLLGDIVTIRDRHAGPIRNVRDTDVPLDQEMYEGSAGMEMERNAHLATDVEAHTVMIAQFAGEMIGAQIRGFFKNMAEMCEAAGTSVKNEGGGIPTIEQARELLRKMDFSFDEAGKPELQLVVDPSQAERAQKFNMEVAQDAECTRIMAEKRQKWMESRVARSRRTLSR